MTEIFQICMPPDLKKKIDAVRDVNRSHFIRDAVEYYFEHLEKEENEKSESEG